MSLPLPRIMSERFVEVTVPIPVEVHGIIWMDIARGTMLNLKHRPLLSPQKL
jgi:hypothetical protein